MGVLVRVRLATRFAKGSSCRGWQAAVKRLAMSVCTGTRHYPDCSSPSSTFDVALPEEALNSKQSQHNAKPTPLYAGYDSFNR